MRDSGLPLHERIRASEQVAERALLDARRVLEHLEAKSAYGEYCNNHTSMAELADAMTAMTRGRVKDLATALRHEDIARALDVVPFGPSKREGGTIRSAHTNPDVMVGYVVRAKDMVVGLGTGMSGVQETARRIESGALEQITEVVRSTALAVPLVLREGGVDGRLIAIGDTEIVVSSVAGGRVRVPLHDTEVRRRFRRSGAAVGDVVTVRVAGEKKGRRMYSFAAHGRLQATV